jgi:putative flippase GtrA
MRQFSRFLIVGVVNTALGYAVIFGCMFLMGMSPELSNATGYMVGLTISYFLHRYYTFKSLQRRGNEFVRFVVVLLVAYTANLVVLVIQVRIMGVHEGVSQIIASVVYVGIAYMLNKYYVFLSDEGR